MRRSSMWLGGRPNASRTSARVTARTAGPLVLPLGTERGKHLSGGALVEASIVARVLGLRLLTLDAVVVLAPAGAAAAPARPRVRVAGAGVTPARTTRHRLDEAVRSLEEGAKLLADARRVPDGA